MDLLDALRLYMLLYGWVALHRAISIGNPRLERRSANFLSKTLQRIDRSLA